MVNKTKLSYGCKNTLLKIDKQGKSVVVTIEHKTGSWLYQCLIRLVVAVLILGVFHAVVYDIKATKCVTAMLAAALVYNFFYIIQEESLIMVHSLGYHYSSKYILGQKDLFIPWNQVQSIFINEVIVRGKLIYLLTILTKDKAGEQLIPLFQELQPRLKYLELICRHLRGANS